MADGMDSTKVVDAEEVKPEVKKGPADEIRQIQGLLINGIFPGNVAPQVVQAYQLLDRMAVEIEKNAAKDVK